MARTAKSVKGTRLTDLIGLGVLTQYIPLKKVEEALEATGRQSKRQRQLPARVMVYYVLALALYMEVGYGEVLRCLIEGLAQCCSHNDDRPNLSPARSGSFGAATGGKLADLSLDGPGVVAASAGADSALQDLGEHGLVDLGAGLRGK